MSDSSKIIQAGAGIALIAIGLNPVAPNPYMVFAGGMMLVGVLAPAQKPETFSQVAAGRLSSGVDPAAYRQVIIGQVRVGGVITFEHVSGAKNQRFTVLVTLAGHELEEIGDFYLGEELVPIDVDGNATGKYAGKLKVQYNLGADDQLALSLIQDATYPSWLGGHYGGIRFDGAGNFGAADATTAFNGATLTIELWVRPMRDQAGTLLSLDGGIGWLLELLDNRSVRWSDGTGPKLSSAALELGVWTHLALTLSAAGQTLWVNGEQAGTTVTAFTNGGSGAVVLRIASLDGESGFACVDADDLQIWNIVRTQANIQQDADNRGLGGSKANRITGIEFDETSGANADDVESPEHDLTLFPTWTDNHRQCGCAGAAVQAIYDEALFPNGLGNLSWVCKGLKPEDPRVSPVAAAWSQNWALAVRQTLVDTDHGLGYDPATLDDDTFAAAANLSDEDVGLSAGGTEKRYAANGAYSQDRTWGQTLKDLLTAGAGKLVNVGGKWKLYGGAYIAPDVTLTPADFRGEISLDVLPATRDNFNVVKGLFIDPNQNWQPVDIPQVSRPLADGEQRLVFDTSFPFTTSGAACQRLARIQLRRIGMMPALRVPSRLSGLQVEAGGAVAIDWPAPAGPGWSSKPFDVREAKPVSDGGPLGADLVLTETDPGIYDWDAEDVDVVYAPNSNLPNPFVISALENFALESGTAALGIRADGTIFSRIHVTWDEVADQVVNAGGKIEIQYRLSGQSPEAAWIPHEFVSGALVDTFILDVIDGQIYDVRGRTVSSLNVPSAWVTVTGHTVVGKTDPPSDVEGFAVQQNGASCIFRWDHVADLDLAGYETRFAQAGVEWDDATRVTRVTRGTKVTDAAIPPGPVNGAGDRDPWRFFIKAVDTSGNYSTNAATFDLVVQSTYNAIFQEQQWPAWNGELVNLRRNPLTGNIHLASQDTFADVIAGAATVADLFATFCPNPYPSGTYTAPEIDTGGDDRVRIWAETQGFMAPGESGVPNAILEVDTHLEAGAYDGYEGWTIGETDARFVRQRITVEAADGVEILSGLNCIVDLLEHGETETVTVPVGGTTVSFTRAYRLPPQVTIGSATDGGSPPTTRFAQFAAVTATDFWVGVIDNSGDVGGEVTYTTLGV